MNVDAASPSGWPGRRKLHTGAHATTRLRSMSPALSPRPFSGTWMRDRRLQQALMPMRRNVSDCWMPGYTHLQRAQPVLLAHHLLAYVSCSRGNRERFQDCRDRVK